MRDNYTAPTVYIQGGVHITLDNLTIHGGADGIFAKSGSSQVSDLIIKNSYIYDNGVAGNYLYHNMYTEVSQITIEGNYFGPPVAGSPGNNIKDRSSGTIIRYNYIDDGGHLIDLVECQDGCATRCATPEWAETYVYGNILYAGPAGPTFLVHFGTGDGGANADYWRKNLYYYNNTVIVERDQSTSYYIALFRISSNDQTAYVDNNIFYVTPESGTVTSHVLTYDTDSGGLGNFVFGNNWITPGWTETRAGYTFNGTTTGTANFISPTGNDPHFVNYSSGDYNLDTGSDAIDAASSLPSIISSGNALGVDLTPTLEYFNQSTVTRANIDDMGAFAFTGTIDAVDDGPLPPQLHLIE